MLEHWPRNAARYSSVTALEIVGVQCAGGRPPPRLGAEGSGLQAREGSPRRGLVSHVGPGPGGPHRLRDTPEEQRHGEHFLRLWWLLPRNVLFLNKSV